MCDIDEEKRLSPGDKEWSEVITDDKGTKAPWTHYNEDTCDLLLWSLLNLLGHIELEPVIVVNKETKAPGTHYNEGKCNLLLRSLLNLLGLTKIKRTSYHRQQGNKSAGNPLQRRQLQLIITIITEPSGTHQARMKKLSSSAREQRRREPITTKAIATHYYHHSSFWTWLIKKKEQERTKP